MSNGYPPIFVEQVECWLTLRTEASAITVAALDGAGNALGTLPPSEIQTINGGYRIHLQGNGQPKSPWYTIAATVPIPADRNLWNRHGNNDVPRSR
jgi:hypothetical protein